MKKNHIGTIQKIEEINRNVYSIEFSASSLTNIEPGEYSSILCDGLTLRRPFSVADFKNGKITVLFKKKGKGTQYISNLKIGHEIEFSAPLGNTFKIEDKKTLLIGAGIGVAPLFYLNKKLKEIGVETFFAAGFLSTQDILGEFDFASTDDGSNGNKGSICDYLESLIIDFKPEKIVSCAPRPVLKIVSETAQKYGIESEIAMEKIMACGIGICRGCVIQVKKDGKIQNATVCKDGPVFKGEEVVW
jgi:dihydroorotate dehydrogenase electron transfer subunit